MASEIKILEKAQLYIDKLSEGIDPLTNQPVPSNEIIHNERISRCLSYVSEVLTNVINDKIENADNTPEPSNPNFHKIYFNYSSDPISISEISRRINIIHDNADIQKIGRSKLIALLIKKGYLKTVTLLNGEEAVRPTGQGEKIGIITKECHGRNGSFVAVFYSYEAQIVVMELLDNSTDFKKPLLPDDENIFRNRKWYPDEDEELIEMYQKGVRVDELARFFYRPEESICSRLVRLGIIKSRWQAYEIDYTDERIKDKQSIYDKDCSNHKSNEPVGAPKNKFLTGDTARRSDYDPLPKDISGHYRPYPKKI